MRCGNSDVVVELQLPDFVLLGVALGAAWQCPFVRRLLAYAAALAVGCALLPDVHGLSAWFERTFDARKFSDQAKINRIALANLFQLQSLCRLEGVFEQCAGRGDGG
jgi:hypothetical protein